VGNILSLNRNGWQNTSNYNNLDVLSYTYDSGHKLLSVTDSGNKTYGFKDRSFTGNDYAYDANGNLIEDKNKGITSVTYDHFNAPTQINVTNPDHDGNVQYVYDANGVKLKKIALDRGTTNTLEYNGNFVYENGSLKSITHPEGYIEQEDDGSYTYVYEHRDIWKNTRITYADNNKDGVITAAEIRREQNYYPFGMTWQGVNSTIRNATNNLKTFQGQELTEDLGLNTHEWRYRMSDRSIGRFWQIDPLSEDYVYNSTYAFQENKMGMGIELEGLELAPINPISMFNFEGGGKPVLTLGLHNVVLPTVERSEGDGVGTFVGNVAKSMWNGIAGAWNAGMQGENMGDMTTASLKEMGKTADRIAAGEGTQQDAENITAGIVMTVVRSKSGGKGKPTVKQQALNVKKNLNNGKNSVNVGTVEGVTHFDLDGATHKGVETPHVQKSYKNTNAKGETFINKDRKNVRPMNQQDIRTVKKVLEKRKQNGS
jgi:RHS repeat-associated protein